MNEAPRHTITRRLDEPKLEIGQLVSVKKGVIGVVIARYTPPGKDELCYVVQERSDGESDKR